MTLGSTNITVDELLNGYTVNLTSDGVCTSNISTDCVVTSNSTSGVIVNPVRSARLTTKGKKTITYGRIEVVAKMPAGDWLWPAIWCVTDIKPHLSIPFSISISPLFWLSGEITFRFTYTPFSTVG
jgi:hypothetical protein